MADALVSAYVRPEGAYITASDRSTIGLWMESDEWEFVDADDPDRIGLTIVRRLETAPRVVRHPERNEFSTLRSGVIAPLLDLAGVKSWKAFIVPTTLVHIEHGDAITVTPMRRNGRGFSAVPEAREQLRDVANEAVGLAVLRAAQAATEFDSR